MPPPHSKGGRMENDNRFSNSPLPAPRPKPKHHDCSICLTAYFGAAGDDGGAPDSPGGVGELSGASLLCSSSTWLRFRAHELPELRRKCRVFISSHAAKHHRRHHSSDFRYDPFGYALNFDEGSESEYPATAEDLRCRCFSSRGRPRGPSASPSIWPGRGRGSGG